MARRGGSGVERSAGNLGPLWSPAFLILTRISTSGHQPRGRPQGSLPLINPTPAPTRDPFLSSSVEAPDTNHRN